MAQPYDYGETQLAQMMYNNRRGYGGSAGENYYNAGVNLGNDIARAMMYYHQRHVAANVSSSLLDAFSRLGVSPQGNFVSTVDAQGKPIKGVEPLLSKGARDSIMQSIGTDRNTAIGVGRVLNDLLAKHAARTMDINARAMAPQTPLNQARTVQALTRAALTKTQQDQLLGQLPPPPIKPPTGSQIMRQQTAQQKELLAQHKSLLDQQKNIGNTLATQIVGDTNYGGKASLVDPSVLLDDSNIKYGQPGGAFDKKNFYEKTDDKDITHVMIPGGADNGKNLVMPIKQFDRLRNLAERWQGLGQQAQTIQDNTLPALQKQHAAFNEAWMSQSPQQQQNLINNLVRNPTPVNKAKVDSWFPGAADQLIQAATGGQAPAPTPSPSAAPEDTSDQTDTGSEEQAPQQPEEEQPDTSQVPGSD